MNDKKNGPEFAPIREYVKELKIVVSFYDKKDMLVREEKLDYGNAEDRKWLGKLSWWGWNSGYCVETRKDD